MTALRTGAATAVAARFLARRDARTATAVGCGAQGEVQPAAIAAVRPLGRVRRLDAEPARGAPGRPGPGQPRPRRRDGDRPPERAPHERRLRDLHPSRQALVFRDAVAPGAFVAAVGADDRGKQELEPALVAASTLVVDVLEQCAEIGELQHARAAGLMTRDQVHPELADLVAGRRPGRTREDEITVFDSSGTARHDVAAAVLVYEKASATGRGVEVALDD